MNLYLKGGILSLRQMKEHYNRFEDGGEVDNVHSTPEQAWMVNWINNRQEVLKENIRDTKDFPALYSDKRLSREAFEEAQKQSRRVLSVKQYNYGRGPQFPTVPDDLYKKARNNVVMSTGTYIPVDHSIIYNRYNNPGRTTQVHELTHSMGANPQLDMLLHDKNLPHKNLREGIEKSSYLDSYQEVYPRLMELRRFLNLDPKKRDYTPKDLEEMRKKVGNTNLLDRYSDKYLLNLLNNIASNKATIETDGRKLAAYGGPLRDEYDNPDQYYDYKTAEEVGNMYDPGTQHWASRDPRTGMILKNSKHPTFALAMQEDQSSGYTPFIDTSTGRYFTLRPEEYATAPNKATLRRASTEELEAIYKESNLDSWNKRADFSKIVPGYTREDIAQRKAPYRDTVWEAAKENNINPEIIDALATLESRYDNDATSPAKAKGIMQLMPVNTKDIDPRDGHQNIRRGAKVLADFLKQNKGDMKRAIAAYNGYSKNPKAKVEKEESKGYSDNYYRGLFPLVDSLQKDSTVGYPFADGGFKRDSTSPVQKPIAPGNFQTQEEDLYVGPVVGEIRADERSRTTKFFDKLRTRYNSSQFADSAVAEVLSATTPYGLIHEGAVGNKDTALLSVIPFGARIKNSADIARSVYKAGRAISMNLPSKVEQGFIRASDIKAQQDQLELFREYLNDPVIKKKIPVVYEPRLREFEYGLNHMRKVPNEDLNKYYSFSETPQYLGERTKLLRPTSTDYGQYHYLSDRIYLNPRTAITDRNSTTWPHEYNHFLDADVIYEYGDEVLTKIPPEKMEYLKELVDPYKMSSGKEYIYNSVLNPIGKKVYDIANSKLVRTLRLNSLVPKQKRLSNLRRYRNAIKDFNYYTSPTEAREYMSEGAQALWNANRGQAVPLKMEDAENLFRETDRGLSTLLDMIPQNKRKAFLRNFEEHGFSKGGKLK